MNSPRKPGLPVIAAVGLGTLLVAAGLHGLPFGGGTETPPTEVAVRVDQVGYVRGETKRAYVMGPEAALAGARFKVVDAENSAENSVVTAGRLGVSTGRWNAKYPSVRTVDLSALDAPGTYRIILSGTAAGRSPAFRVAGGRELMTPLVRDNVRFLQAQRDGADVLSDDVRGALRHGPSHLADQDATVYGPPEYDKEGTELLDERLTPTGDHVDVSGGWFDAGDFLKFTGTTSYSVAELLLAQRDVPDMAELSAEASHGLSWLDRMWDEDSETLYAQVGIGVGNDAVRTDHDVWRLPEADDRLDVSPGDPDYTIKHRPVFRAAEPGEAISASLAGRVAAAFALGAQRAADTDPEEAQDWLGKAAAVYALADTDTDTDTDEPPLTAFPNSFYPEDSWQDDMEFGGAELALAARELGDERESDWADDAARWAGAYLRSDVQGTLGVADVSALAHVDLATVLDGDRANGIGAEELYEDLRRQLEDGLARAGHDPFGAGAVYDDFDAVPHTFGLVATARLYARATGDTRYAAFAGRQRGWALGANPWGSSFVIGAGEVYPHCPEHQLANLGGSLTGKGAILRGGVVNGPNTAAKLEELNSFPTMKKCTAAPPAGAWADFDGKGARYLDNVGAWQTVEPALDFTTTALLAFALTAQT
ncbi:glycoside hydrolase family 9 protein [Streptomyces sp. NPDC048484]|uniref:glycoside hydrolase family 9 protein n=1 Tax=Streptomyces sp. NPDC048484 TaxID=3155146 RepID=UPI003446432B